MCLTKEEVRGQKIENELIIANGSNALQILPGGVIDADVLLKSGEFKYMKMDNRKPISISTTSNLARKTSETVNPGRNNNIEDELRTKVHALTRPSNIIGMPNVRSSSEASVSTLQETIGINIGASFFYMGVSADNNFRFSSEQYRFMYLYQFEQECLPVIANGISSPEDVFKDVAGVNNNWLYIREVKYGRRLYVLMESEYDLANYSNELNGNLEWGVVSAALRVKTKGSSLSDKTNIRILTQGGQPVAVTDKSKLQATLDNYFASKFSEMDIVPLSYKLTYLDGEPVSMISNAFLNGNNCLDKNKIRIRVTKIECKQIDDNKNNEEIYGSANIALYNTSNKLVAPDGKTLLPMPMTSTGAVSYGSKDAPLVIQAGTDKAKNFDINQQGKYFDVLISSLDMAIAITPFVHEKDNVLNKDDDYITQDRMRKTLRQMLTEGSTTPVFEFRRKNSVLLVYFEITPM
jgi:hypothetical protein